MITRIKLILSDLDGVIRLFPKDRDKEIESSLNYSLQQLNLKRQVKLLLDGALFLAT
jgi:hypothetical protein